MSSLVSVFSQTAGSMEVILIVILFNTLMKATFPILIVLNNKAFRFS